MNTKRKTTSLWLKLGALVAVLYLNLPLTIILLYAFTTDDSTFTFPPPGLTLNWFAVACELQRDWRKNGEGLANLLANHLPAYKNLITSHNAKK